MEEAAERRERLKALRAAAELTESAENGVSKDTQNEGEEREQNGTEANHENVEGVVDDEEDEEAAELRFRNYLPRDQGLHHHKLPAPEQPKFEEPTTAPAVEAEPTEDPILSIAPKKPNWDLRRDVAKRMEKLERRTQRAMIELMQEEEKARQAATGQVADMVEEE